MAARLRYLRNLGMVGTDIAVCGWYLRPNGKIAALYGRVSNKLCSRAGPAVCTPGRVYSVRLSGLKRVVRRSGWPQRRIDDIIAHHVAGGLPGAWTASSTELRRSQRVTTAHRPGLRTAYQPTTFARPETGPHCRSF
jgi:hypothetical protein